MIGNVGVGDGCAALVLVRAQPAAQSATQRAAIRSVDTGASFATSVEWPRRAREALARRHAKRERMTHNADVMLFLYAVVLVGVVTGAQMWYVGVVVKQPMRFGGEPVAPAQLRAAGATMTVAGTLAFAVMAVEILSGAAGTDIRAFIIATCAIPPIVAGYNIWRNRRSRA